MAQQESGFADAGFDLDLDLDLGETILSNYWSESLYPCGQNPAAHDRRPVYAEVQVQVDV